MAQSTDKSRSFSSLVVDGMERAPCRAMLRAEWQQPAPRYTRRVLVKYAKLVSSISKGAVHDNLD